jgi:hypothetical protein
MEKSQKSPLSSVFFICLYFISNIYFISDTENDIIYTEKSGDSSDFGDAALFPHSVSNKKRRGNRSA